MRFVAGRSAAISNKRRKEIQIQQKENESLNNEKRQGRSNKYRISDKSVDSLDEIKVDFSKNLFFCEILKR